MRLGFLLDHDRCIGCHACTVACKAENDVPVGDFRTWVKYLEQGTFPDTRRHFAVLRCNHCTDAPCVTICPVNALEKRSDGIVDIDRDACIGCRACMQACPYDAIYLNDDLGSVEKCHYCAHRTEKGLEPACVIVCPEQAIVSGDLDDPRSKIARMLEENDTLVRRPEQGTGPNVHYKGVHPTLLAPGVAKEEPTYLWSDKPKRKQPAPLSLPVLENTRVVLDAPSRIEWGWPVALYLLTKGIAAGVAILAPFAAFLVLTGATAAYLPEAIALTFTTITTILLIEDLKKPWAFYRLITRPNWRSWLVKGGVILGAFTATTSLAILARLTHLDTIADTIRWINLPLGLAVAGYTAFLFAQCKGRDLWESRWLLPHLLVQALHIGAITLLPFSTEHKALIPIAALAGLAHIALALRERLAKHRTNNANQAAAYLTHLRWPANIRPFHHGLILTTLSIGLAGTLPELALIPALLGLYMYEWAFIRAAQEPPLS